MVSLKQPGGTLDHLILPDHPSVRAVLSSFACYLRARFYKTKYSHCDSITNYMYMYPPFSHFGLDTYPPPPAPR